MSTNRLTVVVRLASRAEMDDAVDQREEGVILTDADVLTGHDSRTALADDDLTGAYLLSVTTLNAKIFWI